MIRANKSIGYCLLSGFGALESCFKLQPIQCSKIFCNCKLFALKLFKTNKGRCTYCLWTIVNIVISTESRLTLKVWFKIKILWAFVTSLCEMIQVKTFWVVFGVNKVHNISAANSWWPSHLIFVKKDSADILEIPLTLGFSFKSAFSLEPNEPIRDEGRVSNV